MTENIKREVIRQTAESGDVYYIERYERRLPVSEVYSFAGEPGCGACPNRGKNFSCPPFSPSFTAYVNDTSTAKVIGYRVPLKHFKTGDNVENMRTAFLKIRTLLVAELFASRAAGNIVAGSGHCRECPECAATFGEKSCRYPDKMMYSLESMGINVASLTEKALDIKLEWSDKDHAANYVTAVGAVFLRG